MKLRTGLSSLIYLWFLVLVLGPVWGLATGAFEGGWSSFWREITRPEALFALRLTFLITAVVIVLNTVLGILVALYLVRSPYRERKLINGIVDLPFAVSPVIAGFMLVLLYGPNSIIGTFFGNLGVKIIFALPGMILATLFVSFPFVVRELVPVLQEIGIQQEEAAYTLGADRWTAFWRVTLPAVKESVLYGIVLTTARSLGEFGAVLVVSGNLINQTQSATMYVYQAAADFNTAGAYAVSLVLAAISFVILILLEILKKRKGVVHP